MAPNHLGSTDHSITLRHLANSGWNSSNLEPPVVAVSARLVRWVGSEWDRISSSRLAPGHWLRDRDSNPDLPFIPGAEVASEVEARLPVAGLTLETASLPWFLRTASAAVATPKPRMVTRTPWSRSWTRCRSSRPLHS